MLSQTTFEQFKVVVDSALQKGKRSVSVVREILGDFITPMAAYLTLRGHRSAALLESVAGGRHQGRYSIIGASPYLQLSIKAGVAESKRLAHLSQYDIVEKTTSDPLGFMEKLLSIHSPEKNLPFFTGGAVGYIGHEAITLIEPSIPRHHVDDLALPDILLLFYRYVLVFDLHTQSLYLIRNVHLKSGVCDLDNFEAALRDLDDIERLLKTKQEALPDLLVSQCEPRSNVSDEKFELMVLKAKTKIADGEIFQVVLSRRFETEFQARSIDFYRMLRRENPSPYLFHLDFESCDERPRMCLVGASPEIMVRVDRGKLLIRPLAGTKKRGANDAEDISLAAELASDPKERAEHIMLVDLARNDVGRFCRTGSVKVEGLMRVEPYGAVLHMATDVSGELLPEVQSIHALLGCLPAGTLSGAPKISALRIIAELEPCARGPYGGAVGWFTDTDLDTCIMIRSAVLYDRKLYWQVGAGIVADSVPSNEREEINAKATATVRVLAKLERKK